MQNSPTSGPPSPVPGLTDLQMIARGGYATVYRARQPSVGREVALKIDTRTVDEERDRRRFLREAEAAGRMSGHPNIVTVYDAGVTGDNHPYLVMELCTGGSLADRLKKSGPLTPAEARTVGVKIADALAAAHGAGILHRDVKPGNILITRYGEPGLADFGLAAAPDPTREMSVTVEALTPAYAAPEVFRMERPTAAADVYALAATLYALLAGHPPRWPDTGTPSLATMVRMHEEPIPDLVGVPPGLTDVLRKGMASEAEDRYATAAQFRDALAAASLAVPPTAVPASGPPAAGPPAAAPQLGPPSYRPGGQQPYRYSVPPPTYAGPAGYGLPGESGPPGAPGSPTAAAPPLRRGRRTLIAVFVAVVAVLVIGAGVALAVLKPFSGDPNTDPNGQGRTTPTQDVGPDSPTGPSDGSTGGGATGGVEPFGSCPLELVGARCPTTPECFDKITRAGRAVTARRVSCAGRHTWETFLLADLPAEVRSSNYQDVKNSPIVSALCAPLNLTLALDGGDTTGWSVDVLPPNAPAFASGDRVFRCVAGRGANALTRSYFGNE